MEFVTLSWLEVHLLTWLLQSLNILTSQFENLKLLLLNVIVLHDMGFVESHYR